MSHSGDAYIEIPRCSRDSQPAVKKVIYRFWFRVDKIDESWDGSLCIGAVPFLPTESLPEGAMRLDPPAWIISSDLKYNGNDLMTHVAPQLDEVVEQSVLTLHFRFSSELLVDIDGNVLGAIGYVPRNYGHVYPLVDLYGKVSQISVLLHPYTVVTGTSLDLPVIVENRREEDSLTEPNVDIVEDEAPVLHPPIVERVEVRRRWKSKASSQDSLMESYDHIIEPGPSCMLSKPHVSILNNEMRNKEIKNRTISALHHSLILNATDNKETSLRGVQRSHSTNDFLRLPETEHAVLPIQFINQHLYDTNIRHNDRYPEANDVDYLDYEIMDALALESGNLPDLSEEQSSSIDESTRRDDLSSEPLSYEHLIYIHKILGLHREIRGQQSLEAEWEALGEGCDHLHATLKYWFDLVVPFQELRRELCSGYVKCYCTNCEPSVDEDLAGWVCIEKRDSERASQGFWRVKRSTLSMAQAVCLDVCPRRPRLLRAGPPSGTGPGEVLVQLVSILALHHE